MRDPVRIVKVALPGHVSDTSSTYTVILRLSRDLNGYERTLFNDESDDVAVSSSDPMQLSIGNTTLEEIEARILEINERLSAAEKGGAAAELQAEQAKNEAESSRDAEVARRKALLAKINSNLP